MERDYDTPEYILISNTNTNNNTNISRYLHFLEHSSFQMERDYDTPEGKEGADDDAYMMPMEQRDPMM